MSDVVKNPEKTKSMITSVFKQYEKSNKTDFYLTYGPINPFYYLYNNSILDKELITEDNFKLILLEDWFDKKIKRALAYDSIQYLTDTSDHEYESKCKIDDVVDTFLQYKTTKPSSSGSRYAIVDGYNMELMRKDNVSYFNLSFNGKKILIGSNIYLDILLPKCPEDYSKRTPIIFMKESVFEKTHIIHTTMSPEGEPCV